MPNEEQNSADKAKEQNPSAAAAAALGGEPLYDAPIKPTVTTKAVNLDLKDEQEAFDLAKANKIKLYPIAPNPNLPEPILEEGIYEYSPGFANGKTTPHNGLTLDEQKKYLPAVIRIPADDPAFFTRVNDFYTEYSIVLPYAGLEVDGSLDENGNPVNLEHFLLFKMVTSDNNVCRVDNLENKSLYSFYLEDLTMKRQQEKEEFTLKNKAKLVYIKLISPKNYKRSLAEQILLAGEKHIEMTTFEIIDVEDYLIQKELETFSTKYPKEFIAISADPNVQYKALVSKAIGVGVMHKTGDAYFLNEERLSSSYRDVIAKLKSEPNVVAEINALINEAIKLSVA